MEYGRARWKWSKVGLIHGVADPDATRCAGVIYSYRYRFYPTADKFYERCVGLAWCSTCREYSTTATESDPPHDVGSAGLPYDLCGANWARWNGSTKSLHFWVETKDGNSAGGTTGGGLNYTTITDGTQPARACVFRGFDDTQVCTDWH